MKRILPGNSLFLLAALLFSGSLSAQLLWRAEGKDKQDIYIFGTMHLPMGQYVQDHPSIRQTMDTCDAVYVEVSLDQDSLQSVIMDYVLLPKGMSLKDSLTDDQWHVLDSAIRQMNPMWTAGVFKRFKPIYIQLLYSYKFHKGADSDTQTSVDRSVMEYATAAGMDLRYLETQAEQLDFVFNQQPLHRQFSMLRKDLDGDSSQSGMATLAGRLPEVYRKMDLDSIGLIINTMSAGGLSEREFLESLLSNRNKNWMTTILRNSAESGEVVFYAVGAGHLVGENGLLAMLRNEGFTVEPVIYD